MTCPTPTEMVTQRLNELLTQYRESPKLKFMITTYLTKVAEMGTQLCSLPELMDINVAVGDQLTLLGKRLGWPRCHCVCEVQPVFGFECEGVVSNQPVSGFCDGNATWMGCGEFGTGDVCITDDELYRKFLKVRVYQYLGYFSLDSLQKCVKIFWGPQAVVEDAGHGRVVVAPGRDLESAEIALLQLYPRVLPVALGIRVTFHFGEIRVFGFGDGWGGFCELVSDEEPLVDSDGAPVLDDEGAEITVGPIYAGAPWMCEIDVRPYSC